jgi:hypothetical protein
MAESPAAIITPISAGMQGMQGKEQSISNDERG